MKTWVSTFLIAVILALTQSFAGAQQIGRVPRIGYLNTPVRRSSVSSDGPRHLSEGFRQGLRELGYVEGQNIILYSRIGEEWEFHDLAADLVRHKMDVIVTPNLNQTRAAMNVTKTIPIVMSVPSDPVFNGLVESLERPGGNVTGISGLTLGLGGKLLELIKETIPSAKRVAVFWNRRAEETFPVWRSVDSAARSLGVDLQWLEMVSQNLPAQGLSPFDRNLNTAAWRQADVFIVLPGTAGGDAMQKIAEFGIKNRIPGIFWRTDLNMDQNGGLLAYGANRFEQSRRAAYFVDKILKGAKPSELPVEPPKSFELIVNLKAAKTIGVAIPQPVLAWADRVIK